MAVVMPEVAPSIRRVGLWGIGYVFAMGVAVVGVFASAMYFVTSRTGGQAGQTLAVFTATLAGVVVAIVLQGAMNFAGRRLDDESKRLQLWEVLLADVKRVRTQADALSEHSGAMGPIVVPFDAPAWGSSRAQVGFYSGLDSPDHARVLKTLVGRLDKLFVTVDYANRLASLRNQWVATGVPSVVKPDAFPQVESRLIELSEKIAALAQEAEEAFPKEIHDLTHVVE